MSLTLASLPDWQNIDQVLLDMDGTLLDLHFDNHFWQHHLPLRYAEARGISHSSAKQELDQRYHARIGTLDWYSVDFWQTELDLDIMALKQEVAHLIGVHPHVIEFLHALRQTGKRVALVTNAHRKSLNLKMSYAQLDAHFDVQITSHETGLPKENTEFWQRLRKILPFDPAHTLLVDDSLPVLDSAHAYGIAHLLAIRCPDSQQPPKTTGHYAAVHDFSELLSDDRRSLR